MCQVQAVAIRLTTLHGHVSQLLSPVGRSLSYAGGRVGKFATAKPGLRPMQNASINAMFVSLAIEFAVSTLKCYGRLLVLFFSV